MKWLVALAIGAAIGIAGVVIPNEVVCLAGKLLVAMTLILFLLLERREWR